MPVGLGEPGRLAPLALGGLTPAEAAEPSGADPKP